MAYHHGNLRAELLARAETVLAEDGVGALSLRSLARDLGVSHAAPSRHFADRQALLDALAVEGFERLGAELAESTSGDGGFEDRLTWLALTYVRFATRYPALLEVMYACKYRDPQDKVRAASAACGEILLDLFDGSGASVADAERFGVILLAALHGIAALTAADSLPPGSSADDLAADTVGRLLRGSRLTG
ncbi:TetR/AcrR family transcriptional regulator [Streptomyces sp. NPDC059477]|uniref:TetR/AcrR family transcriptional regulator n=1 Tax=Streptomyces sp. NPDC059477 TaxID=3346847 RepID=UPI0036A21D50